MARREHEYHHPSLGRARCVGKLPGTRVDADEGVEWECWTEETLAEVHPGENYRPLPSIYWKCRKLVPTCPAEPQVWTCPACLAQFAYVSAVQD